MHRLQHFIHQSKTVDYSDTDGVLCISYVIPNKHRYTNTYRLPKYDSYILGKMEHITTSTTQTTGCQSGKLCRDDLLTGDGTSMDQFAVSIKDRTLKLVIIIVQSIMVVASMLIILLSVFSATIGYHYVQGEILIGKRIIEREDADFGFKFK